MRVGVARFFNVQCPAALRRTRIAIDPSEKQAGDRGRHWQDPKIMPFECEEGCSCTTSDLMNENLNFDGRVLVVVNASGTQ